MPVPLDGAESSCLVAGWVGEHALVTVTEKKSSEYHRLIHSVAGSISITRRQIAAEPALSRQGYNRVDPCVFGERGAHDGDCIFTADGGTLCGYLYLNSPTAAAILYGPRPRLAGQAAAMEVPAWSAEHAGTPLYPWAKIEPTGAVTFNGHNHVTAQVLNNTIYHGNNWHLGVYPASSAGGFSRERTLVLVPWASGYCDGWHVFSGADRCAKGRCEFTGKFFDTQNSAHTWTCAAGVDPLLLASAKLTHLHLALERARTSSKYASEAPPPQTAELSLSKPSADARLGVDLVYEFVRPRHAMGVLCGQVADGSAAAAAGLRAGDLLHSINGESVLEDDPMKTQLDVKLGGAFVTPAAGTQGGGALAKACDLLSAAPAGEVRLVVETGACGRV